MEKANFDELLKTYKVRLKTVLFMLDDLKEKDEETRKRLTVKIGCYRTFINELEEAMQ